MFYLVLKLISRNNFSVEQKISLVSGPKLFIRSKAHVHSLCSTTSDLQLQAFLLLRVWSKVSQPHTMLFAQEVARTRSTDFQLDINEHKGVYSMSHSH